MIAWGKKYDAFIKVDILFHKIKHSFQNTSFGGLLQGLL